MVELSDLLTVVVLQASNELSAGPYNTRVDFQIRSGYSICVGALLFSVFLPILLEEGGGGSEN